MTKHVETIFSQIRRIWDQLLFGQKKQLALLVVLMVITSFCEVISISAVFPFLGVLTSPEIFFTHESVKLLIQGLQIQNPQDLLLPFTLLFIGRKLDFLWLLALL